MQLWPDEVTVMWVSDEVTCLSVAGREGSRLRKRLLTRKRHKGKVNMPHLCFSAVWAGRRDEALLEVEDGERLELDVGGRQTKGGKIPRVLSDAHGQRVLRSRSDLVLPLCGGKERRPALCSRGCWRRAERGGRGRPGEVRLSDKKTRVREELSLESKNSLSKCTIWKLHYAFF